MKRTKSPTGSRALLIFFNRRKAGSIASASGLQLASVAYASDLQLASVAYASDLQLAPVAYASGLSLAPVAYASGLSLAPVAYAPTIWLTIAAASVTFTCLSPLTSASRNLRIEAFSKLSYAALYML